ncbi:MAG TPA: hypothetical protein VH639_01670 [Bryobacteraceae bacterium]|jgi:hypothetical protein
MVAAIWRRFSALKPSFSAHAVLLPVIFASTPKAAKRVLEFFTAQINNDQTRKAYMNAARRFADWCEVHGVGQLAQVQPIHIAAFTKEFSENLRRLR